MKSIVLKDLSWKDSFVLMSNDDVAAYLLCYGPDGGSVSAGYTGRRHISSAEFRSFLYETVRRLFASYERIDLEIDDCDNSAVTLGELFSATADKSWDTYIK